MYTSFHITQRPNKGRSKLSVGTLCGQCHKPLPAGQHYTVHGVRTAASPAPSFHYYHWDHAPCMGSGWGAFKQGEKINSPTDVKVGDLLLDYNSQFSSYNVVRVTQTQWAGDPVALAGKKFYGILVDPEATDSPRVASNGTFCVWDFDINQSMHLWHAVK